MSASGELGTSRRYIDQQYGDDRNLAARQSIYAYQRPRLDLHNSSLDLAALRGDETVVEIGCGNGRYLSALRARGHRGPVVGADLSAGILRTARAAFDGPLLVADAQALPFSDASADLVLAMHMLYHVPDRARAIRELRRVTRPGGVVLALTNSEVHFRELDDVIIESANATIGATELRTRASLTLFKAETAAAELEAAFDSVEPNYFASELVIDAVEPVVAYAASMGAFVAGASGMRGVVLDEVGKRVAERIAADGAFRITNGCAAFVCR